MNRLGEQGSDQLLQQIGAKLEIDMEVNQAAAIGPVLETPAVLEMPKRAIRISDVDAARPVELDPRRKPLPEHPETDCEFGMNHVAVPRADPGGPTPGQELRVTLDGGDEIEQSVPRYKAGCVARNG